jgi:hypothetical protein
MPNGRVYTVDSGQIAVAVNTQTPLLMVATNSTTNLYIQALRVGVASGSSGASYVQNGTVQPYLARASNTPSGGTTITPTSHRASGQACNSTWTIGSWSTAPTCPTPTAGGVLWGVPFALTAGANWGEWVTPQSEWEIGPSSWGAFFVTCSSAPTNAYFAVEMVFTE